MPLNKGEPYDFLANYIGQVDTTVEPARAVCAYRMHGGRLHYDVCILGAVGPQSVKSVMRDGQHIEWESHWEGDMLVFAPPDGHDILDGFLWGYDVRIQRGEAMHGTTSGRKELERFAMGYKVAVTV